MKSQVLKRTFSARKFVKGSKERELSNQDALHSEYYTSHKWLVRTPAVMSDGSPNPSQEHYNKTFATRRAADIFADETDSAACSSIALADEAREANL